MQECEHWYPDAPQGVDALAYLIPTPPVTKTNLPMLATSIPGGGHTKLPPTLISSSDFKILDACCQSHAAGGFPGEF